MHKRVITSALVAVGAHFAVFASWVTIVALDIPMKKSVMLDTTPPVDPEMTVVLQTVVETPELTPQPEAVAPAEKKESKTEPPVVEKKEDANKLKVLPKQERRFANTSAEQAGKPDADTNIIGERDTRAASEMAPTPGAPENLPSQDGRDPLNPNHIETVNKDYQDGSVGMDNQGAETEQPQEATAGKKEMITPEETNIPEEAMLKLSPDAPLTVVNRYLKQGEIIAKMREEVRAEQKKVQESLPDRSLKESELDGKGSVTEQELKKDAFSGYTSKTKVTGSISRSGQSALNVKNSPLGRYQALVSKAVELQWRRNCEQHRDHIVPGVISMRFYVDKNGDVSGIKFHDVVGANYIERGFTQRAIRQAELPKMPSSVLKELKGAPLELIYNFYF